MCFWGKNDDAKERYGYAIPNNALPVSNNSIDTLETLETEYGSYLNWEYPSDPSPWTDEHKLDFIMRALALYFTLVKELGTDFELINEVSRCVS